MVEDLIKKAKDQDIELEIFVTETKETSIRSRNDQIKDYTISDNKEYKIKALYKNKTITLTTDNVKDSNYILEQIKNNATLIDNNDQDLLVKKDTLDEVKGYNLEFDFRKIMKDLTSLNKLKEKYQELISIECHFSTIYQKLSLINCLDTKLCDDNSRNCCYVEIVIQKNGINQTGYGTIYLKDFSIKKIKDFMEEKIKEAYLKIEAKSCNTKKYNIVLDNKCVYSLLNAFKDSFHAKTIHKKLSILNEKYNTQIFSPKLTLVEDPTNDKYIGKRLFDDEGVRTSFKKIVDHGLFKTKLYDQKTALKDNVSSTGNSYGVRNMYLEPGTLTQEELFKKLDRGIYIDSLQGLHAGIDLQTGNISLQAEGYIIKDGKKEQALKLIVMSTNFLELFSSIIEVGSDLEFFSVYGGSPSLLIENVSIAGNVA